MSPGSTQLLVQTQIAWQNQAGVVEQPSGFLINGVVGASSFGWPGATVMANGSVLLQHSWLTHKT